MMTLSSEFITKNYNTDYKKSLYEEIRDCGYNEDNIFHEDIAIEPDYTFSGTKSAYYVPEVDVQIIISRNYYRTVSNSFILSDFIDIEFDYKKRKREYAKTMGKLAKKCKIPFELALALGDEDLMLEVRDNVHKINTISDTDLYQIRNCGIGRRKESIRNVLGENISANLYWWIENAGQHNSNRLASYINDYYSDKK